MLNVSGIPGLIKIDHIGIAVFDLNDAIKWYSDFLGAKLLSRESNLDQMIEEATLELVGSQFQLIMPINELSTVTKFLNSRGQGLQQIALQVSNLEIAVEYAIQNGVRAIFDTSREGSGKTLINFLHPKDCFGVLIELVQEIESA